MKNILLNNHEFFFNLRVERYKLTLYDCLNCGGRYIDRDDGIKLFWTQEELNKNIGKIHDMDNTELKPLPNCNELIIKSIIE